MPGSLVKETGCFVTAFAVAAFVDVATEDPPVVVPLKPRKL